MPLTEKVTFNTRLQQGNRVKIPKLIRWHYKLETTQTLKITIHATNVFSFHQSFFGRTTKDGRIVIPKHMLALLCQNRDLSGYIIEVTLQPTTVTQQ